MKNFWSVRAWTGTLTTMLICFVWVWFTFYAVDRDKAQAREIGYQTGIGHAMKYADVPVSEGEYEVIAVIEKWKGTAVVKKVSRYPSEVNEPLLVTDMMPQMMEKGFTFRKSGSSR